MRFLEKSKQKIETQVESSHSTSHKGGRSERVHDKNNFFKKDYEDRIVRMYLKRVHQVIIILICYLTGFL